jgi:hypothetical protein
MTKITQLPQLTPQLGGGGSSPGADCLIIEKVDNGFILRSICADGSDDGLMQECRVYVASRL